MIKKKQLFSQLRIIAIVLFILFAANAVLSKNIFPETKDSKAIKANINLPSGTEQTEQCLTVNLEAGWNIFSSPVVLDSASMQSYFQTLIDKGSLVKIQDEEGWSLEDMGIFGGWTNNIGNIVPTEGYKIKMTSADSIEFCGTEVNLPYPIPLTEGWNIIGFPIFDTIDGKEVVDQLISNGNLLKVQDESGQSIENLGAYGGWQNFIGDMVPGEGYKIKLNAIDTLWIDNINNDTIPETPKKPGEGFYVTTENTNTKSSVQFSDKSDNSYPESEAGYFKTDFQGNGVDHMNFYLVNFQDHIFEEGDEIALFDGAICVAVKKVEKHNLTKRILSIPASSADNQDIKGFTEGDKYSIRVWKQKLDKEFDLNFTYLSGDQSFTKNGSVILSLNTKQIVQIKEYAENDDIDIKCYPNPLSNKVTIELQVVQESLVNAKIYNQFGQLIYSPFEFQSISPGSHQFIWSIKDSNLRDISSGIYILMITVNDKYFNKKLIIKN